MHAATAKTPDLAIDLTGVHKRYGKKVHALRGVDMQVRRGEVFGLLGPNGAGKSTLVKILMTVIRPTKCAGTVLGDRVGKKSTLARVGYLPEHHAFAGYLTGRQVVDYFGAMQGVPRKARRARTEQLLELVGRKEWADQKVRKYSKGMRQRVGIAQSLIADPELVLLDEPTDGVDPVGRRDIRRIVEHVKGEGRTVLLNSHLLSELEMVCDRVSILVKGQVATQGSLDELTAGDRRFEIRCTAPLPAAAATDLAERVGDGSPTSIDGSVVRINTTDPEAIQPVLCRLNEMGAVIEHVEAKKPSLEELFLRAVEQPGSATPGADRGGSKEADS